LFFIGAPGTDNPRNADFIVHMTLSGQCLYPRSSKL